MNPPTRIRWGLALLGGVLAEVAIIVVIIPVAVLFGQQTLIYVVPPVCLVITFVFGLWTARRAASRCVLHGALVGVVAALLYIGLTIGQSLPFAYVLSHFLKVLGGMAGGFAAARRVDQRATSEVGTTQVV